MRTGRSWFRPRTSLVLVVVGVAAVATACLPPAAPEPEPTTTTTTIAAGHSPCAAAASTGMEAMGTPAEDTTSYAAVVDDGTSTRVITQEVTGPGDLAHFRAAAAAQGTVLAIAPDTKMYAQALPAQREAWGFTDDGFRAAWAAGGTGLGVRVAVLDTGVDASHPDLVGRFDPFQAGKDFVLAGGSSAGVTTDPNGHGTHVAGIIAAADDATGAVGGAPGVTIVPVRVLDATGAGRYSDLADAILWAADRSKGNASVLSLSIGGSYDGGIVGAAIESVEDPTNPQYTHPVIVVAAGNSSCSSTAYPAAYGSSNSYGTAFPQVLPVAALCKPTFFLSPKATDECAGDSTFASFSSRAWNGNGPATGVAAPGTSVLSDYPLALGGTGTKVLSGTSMAAPLVAALAALVVAHCPYDTSAQVVSRIEAASTDLGAAGPDSSFGYGAIDPVNTLRAC